MAVSSVAQGGLSALQTQRAAPKPAQNEKPEPVKKASDEDAVKVSLSKEKPEEAKKVEASPNTPKAPEAPKAEENPSRNDPKVEA